MTCYHPQGNPPEKSNPSGPGVGNCLELSCNGDRTGHCHTCIILLSINYGKRLQKFCKSLALLLYGNTTQMCPTKNVHEVDQELGGREMSPCAFLGEGN